MASGRQNAHLHRPPMARIPSCAGMHDGPMLNLRHADALAASTYAMRPPQGMDDRLDSPPTDFATPSLSLRPRIEPFRYCSEAIYLPSVSDIDLPNAACCSYIVDCLICCHHSPLGQQRSITKSSTPTPTPVPYNSSIPRRLLLCRDTSPIPSPTGSIPHLPLCPKKEGNLGSEIAVSKALGQSGVLASYAASQPLPRHTTTL